MVYNPKEEILVLTVLREMGLATPQELSEQLEKLNKPILPNSMLLILERWKAKDAVVIDYGTGQKRYKLAKIPAPFQSLKMENVLKMRMVDAKTLVAELEKEFPTPTESINEPKGKIGNYKTVEITFEAIDPILGGTPVDSETEYKLHRNPTGKPVISPAQMKGWFRENLRLLDINPNAYSWIAFAEAIPIDDEPKLMKVSAPVVVKGRGGVGIAHYEAFAPANKFKTMLRVPLNGIGLKNGLADIRTLFELCETCPKRGLGANPFYLGGKIKLVEMK